MSVYKLSIILLFALILAITPNSTYSAVDTDPTVSQFTFVRGEGDPGFTGDLSLSLPLLTVPGRGGLDFEVKLNYVAGGGVPATQNGSWVGLGWNLNEGQITCSPSLINIVEGCFAIGNNHLASLAWDKYFLTMPNGAGYEIARVGNELYPVKWEALKIVPEHTFTEGAMNYDYNAFTVYSTDGTRYIYKDAVERVTQLAATSRMYNKFNAANKNSYTEVVKISAVLSSNYSDSDGIDGPSDGDEGNWIKFSYSDASQIRMPSGDDLHITYLDEIETPTHKAIFTAVDTIKGYFKDILRYNDSAPEGLYLETLKTIRLYSKNAPLTILKEIEFNYAPLEEGFSWYTTSGIFESNKRRKLENVTEYGAGGKKAGHCYPPLKFEYNDGPGLTKGYADFWGYITNNMNHSPSSTYCKSWLINKLTYPSGEYVVFDYEPDQFIGYEGCPIQSWSGTKQTGGGVRLTKKTVYHNSTDFSVYEYAYAQNLKISNSTYKGYGFVSNISNVMSDEYDWEYSSPDLYYTGLGANYNTDVHYPDITIKMPDSSKIIRYYTNAASGLAPSFSEHYYTGPSEQNITIPDQSVYDYTNEKVKDKSRYSPYCGLCDDPCDTPLYFDARTYDQNFAITFSAKLKDMHDWSSYKEIDIAKPNGWVNALNMNNSWKRGYVYKEVYVDSKGVVVKQIKNDYQMEPMLSTQMIVYTDRQPPDQIYCFIHIGKVTKTKETVKDNIFGTNSVDITKEYKYNDTNGLIEKEIWQGNNNKKVNFTDYAFNHYSGMVNKNMLSQIAQQTVYQYGIKETVPDSPGSDRARSSTVTTWNETGGTNTDQWAPVKTYQWNEKSASSYSLPTFTQWTSGTPDNEWELKAHITDRDKFGRVLTEKNANGNTTKYYYGTNSNPFSTSSTGNYLTGIQKVIISEETPPSSGVRNGDNLFIEYQYNSLGQVIKKIDENGKNTDFAYDDLWRLESIKNNSKHQIAEYEYHYKDQPDWSQDANGPNAILTKTHFGSASSGTTISYYDGLAREIQRQTHDGNEDIIVATDYDNMGRIQKSWKAYLSNTGHKYTDKYDDAESVENSCKAYFDGNPGPKADGYPYLEYQYDADPLGRVKEIGHPGSFFQINSGHQIKYSYGLNLSNDVNEYAASKLYRTTTTDENGNAVKEFVDKLGNKVAQITDPDGLYLVTLFQYDILGNLTKSIPPKAKGSANSPLCTTMNYNTLSQLVEKSTPDAEASSGADFKYRYDGNGNLRFFSDPIRKQNSSFIYYKYDALDRMIETGWYKVNGQNTFESVSTQTSGAPGNDFPGSSDNYKTIMARYVFDQEPAWGTDGWPTDPTWFPTNLKGRLTAVQYKNENISGYGFTYYSYDNDGNIEWTKQQLPGYSIKNVKTIQYEYDWQGNITKLFYQAGVLNDCFSIHYVYDKVGRLAEIWAGRKNKIADAKIVAQYSWWPSGQVKQLVLGENNQTIDYEYTIRDWLAGINSDKFKQKIGYNVMAEIASSSPFSSQFESQYNGNISWATSSSSNFSDNIGYVYNYDNTNRLTLADFGKYANS